MPGVETRVELTVTGDWHVGTGFGVPGGVDASVRRNPITGRPQLAGTAVTGLFRDACRIAAQALDEPSGGTTWTTLQDGLFGAAGRPPLVRFAAADVASTDQASDAARDALGRSGLKVGVAIDPRSGRAADDMLRTVEVSGQALLTSHVQLLQQTSHRGRVEWDSPACEAATRLLVVGAGLVDRLGAGRFRGGGHCTTRMAESARSARWFNPADWLPETIGPAPAPPNITSPSAAVVQSRDVPSPASAETHDWCQIRLDIHLSAPLLAQSASRGNVLRTNMSLPGTTLLSFVHSRLRRANPAETVRDAVTRGSLVVTGATPTLDGRDGYPVPLCLLRPKTPAGRFTARNVLAATAVRDESVVYRPMRTGFVTLDSSPNGAVRLYCDPRPVVAMHNTHDPARQRAADGQLYTVEAIPAGSHLRARVLLRDDLCRDLGGAAAIADLLTGAALLGTKAKSEYGRVQVEATLDVVSSSAAGDPAPPAGPPSDDTTVTLLCASDIVVRGRNLAPAAPADLLSHLAGLGIGHPDRLGQTTLTARYHRIDGWYGAASRPRSTLIALRAGSIVTVPRDDVDLQALAAVARHGIGERRAEGYGRVHVDPAILREPSPVFDTVDADTVETGPSAAATGPADPSKARGAR